MLLNYFKPNGGFIRNLAWGDAIILDPDTANGAALEPNGTGPFKFSKWVKGDRVELVKNNNYWGEAISLEKPHLNLFLCYFLLT